jgi:hypothetical protein
MPTADPQLEAWRVPPGGLGSFVHQNNDLPGLLQGGWAARWLSGQYGYARDGEGRGTADTPLTLPGGEILRQFAGDRESGLLQQGPGWLLYARRNERLYDKGGFITFQVCARTPELADELAAAFTAGLVPPGGEAGEVEVAFWYASRDGARRSYRAIQVPAWEEISGNYTARLRDPLAALMGHAPDGRPGRLVLLHGPPGTGKTYLLRALAAAWRTWCNVQYVLDAGRFLDDSGYLMEVMLDQDRYGLSRYRPGAGLSDAGRWRLVILEDCGTLLRGGESGDALSTLLNLSDGMLGQGQNLMFALTTNDERGQLDAKLIRPGRCLASLEVPPLEPAEAARWLGRPLPAGTATDLASLYQLRDGTGIPGANGRRLEAVGQYL